MKFATTLLLLISFAASAKSVEMTEEKWNTLSKEAVKERLKDPESVKFKDMFYSDSYKNIDVTCGYVNAKNGFGGYNGFERFVASGTNTNLVFFETEVGSFDKVWTTLCENNHVNK